MDEASRAPMQPRPRAPRGRRALWCVALAVLAASLLRLGVVLAAQLEWPFDLRYETPNLSTVQLIRDGSNPYSPAVYADGPFVLTQYAPLYLWLVAWLPDVPGQPYLVGRCVSIVAMLFAAALLFRADGRRTDRALAALGVGWFFLLHAALGHTADFRVDALALAFSLSSLVLVQSGRPASVLPAAGLAALAVATRQSSVAAAGAGLLYLCFTDRRAALRFGGLLALLLGAGALLATRAWGDGFWFSLLAATRPPSSFAVLATQWGLMLSQPAFSFLLLVAVVAGVASRARRPFATSPWPAFALLSGVVLLATSSTTGTHEGHFLEFGAALLFWVVFALGRSEPSLWHPRAAPLALLLCALLPAHELIGTWTDAPGLPLPSGPQAEHVRERYAELRPSLDARGIPHRNVLSIGGSREASCVAERVCLTPAWVYDQLWASGDLSTGTLVSAVRRQAFDVIVVTTSVPFPSPGERSPRAEVLRAVKDSYDPLGEDSILRYFRPRR